MQRSRDRSRSDFAVRAGHMGGSRKIPRLHARGTHCGNSAELALPHDRMAYARQQRTAGPEKHHGAAPRRPRRSRGVRYENADRKSGASVPQGRPRCTARPSAFGRLSNACGTTARPVADQRRNLHRDAGAVQENTGAIVQSRRPLFGPSGVQFAATLTAQAKKT